MSNFVPLMFLQGPYFSTEGAVELPKAKSWWEHRFNTIFTATCKINNKVILLHNS